MRSFPLDLGGGVPGRVLVRPALSSGLVTSALLALAALTGAAVRVLPWLLDPSVPLATAAPFARSLVAVALEAALLTGFPVGLALATHRFTEREEARTLMLLGQRPRALALRLLPIALGFSTVVGIASLVVGADAREPGRILNELVARGERACRRADRPTVFTIPFADAAWLCAPPSPPRLAARGPGSLAGVLVTAEHARFSEDLRSMHVDDARLAIGQADVHVRELSLTGLPPWASASILPSWLRAVVMGLSGVLAACVGAWAVLGLRASRPSSRTHAVVVGASGPLVALGVLRALERTAPETARLHDLALFLLVPALAGVAPWLLVRILLVLPKRMRTATPTG